MSTALFLITDSIARSAKRRYIGYAEGNFEGRHVAPMGVKFGMKEWTEIHGKFHPYRCKDKDEAAKTERVCLQVVLKVTSDVVDAIASVSST